MRPRPGAVIPGIGRQPFLVHGHSEAGPGRNAEVAVDLYREVADRGVLVPRPDTALLDDEVRRAGVEVQGATVARFLPRSLARRCAQAFSQFGPLWFSITVAAWKSAVRRPASPALVMRPTMSRSPDWSRRGVSPAQGPTSFDLRNRAGSSIAET